MLVLWVCIFFFKPNTAYDVRISDWSSDLCSSDLAIFLERAERRWILEGRDEDIVAAQLVVERQPDLVSPGPVRGFETLVDDLEFDRRGGARAHPVGRDDLANRQVGARQRRHQDRRIVARDRKSPRLNPSH